MRKRRAQTTVRWIIGSALALVAVVVGGYLALRFLRPTVTVTEVVEAPVVQAFYSTGTIQPQREYPIKSSTAGTISQVLVDKGDPVKKGQSLAIVTDPALVFTANKAQAELDEKLHRAEEATSPVLLEFAARLKGTQELLEIAQREVKRITDLMSSNAGSQNDLDRAMDRVKALLIEVEAIKAQRAAKKLELDREVEVARAALNIANWNLEEQTLKSPIDGVVLDRPIPVGTRVAVNDQLMRIADVAVDNLVMRADVDEEDVSEVSVGQTVRMTLYAFPGQVLTGKVSRIYDQADAARRTFEVDVNIDSAGQRLQPGMTGELAFIIATRDKALVVPSQAVQGGAVFTVEEGRVVKANVEIGLRSIERFEVLSGLAPGARVVISPISADSVGNAVRIRYMDPVTAAGHNKPPPITEPFKAFAH